MSQGTKGVAAPLFRAKPSFLVKSLNFLGSSQRPKMKNDMVWYLFNEKWN